jgi:hypothetical protein
VVWLTVTMVTRPEPRETLEAFYRKTRPAGPGWRSIAASTGIASPRGEIARNAVFWLLGITLVYAIMFGTGAAIFGESGRVALWGTVAAVSGLLLWAGMRREPAA